MAAQDQHQDQHKPNLEVIDKSILVFYKQKRNLRQRLCIYQYFNSLKEF